MVSGYPTSINSSQVDGLSTDPRDLGRHTSTHFPLAECRRFFKVIKRVLLDSSAWPLLCEYRRVEYKFMIFNLRHKFLYTMLSNYGPLSVMID